MEMIQEGKNITFLQVKFHMENNVLYLPWNQEPEPDGASCSTAVIRKVIILISEFTHRFTSSITAEQSF